MSTLQPLVPSLHNRNHQVQAPESHSQVQLSRSSQDSGTEDSEGSIDDPSSTYSIMDISLEESEEEEQQEPQ